MGAGERSLAGGKFAYGAAVFPLFRKLQSDVDVASAAQAESAGGKLCAA